MLNYYAILGLDADASAEGIRHSYLTKLKQFHPDIYHGNDAEEKTREINEAYACLSNAERRAEYDKDWHKLFGANRIPSEAEVLAKLHAEFAGKNYLWRQQTEERLAQIEKDTEAELKAIFIANKQVSFENYQSLNRQMTEKMRGYEQAKKRIIEDYYTAAARPDFEPQALIKLQNFRENAINQVGDAFTSATLAANRALNHAFGILNPEYSEEATRKREQKQKEEAIKQEEELTKQAAEDKKTGLRIMWSVLILLITIFAGILFFNFYFSN